MADGRVLYGGSPLAGCRVIAGDERSGSVVAHAETEAAGAFELTLAEREGIVVVALAAGAALGVVAAPAGESPLELAERVS